MNLKQFYEENKLDLKVAGISSFLTSFIAYYFFMLSGYSLPDGIVEGLYYYVNQIHHLVDGRWAVRYLNWIFGHNIVMPHIVVIGYALCIAVSAILIKKLFKIESEAFLALIAAVMSVSSVVTEQLTFPHVALTFSVAFLCAVLYVYMVDKKNILSMIAGIVALAVCMGLYQAYLGAAVGLIVLLGIVRLLEGNSVKEVLISFLRFAVTGILGCVLDVAEYTTEIKLRGFNKAMLVDNFGLSKMIEKLHKTFPETYSIFFEYFNDSMLSRNLLYGVFAAIVLVAVVVLMLRLIKEKKYINIIITVVLIAALPVAMNIIRIMIPYYPMHILMKYHLVLMIPFGIAVCIMAYKDIKFENVINVVSYLIVVAIISTYVISANATFLSMRVSYKAIETNTQMVLNDVYDVEGYIPGETTILFAGFPNEGNIREKLDIYDYAILETGNVAYWENYNGITNCKRNYLLHYFGLESGTFTEDEYRAVTESEEFKDMPIWPAEGSVKMINGMVVAKLTDEPPVI